MTSDTLVYVQILFRHGNRTPATSFANDEHRNNQFKPYGQGALTHEGKKNAYNLGKTLRTLYGELLGGEYDPNVLSSVSSGMTRTEMTLQCVHAGLFPINARQQLDDGLTWQPILYDVYPKTGDKVLGLIKNNNGLLDVSKTMDSETEQLYSYVGKHAGQAILTSHDFFKVQNAIQVQKELGLAPPAWSMSIPPETMMERTLDFWEDIVTHRLAAVAGPLVKVITDNFTAKVRAPGSGSEFADRRMSLFSGHDVNVVALLGAFNAFKREYIRYCSFIAIELHEIDRKHFVKILFQNGSDEATRKHLRHFATVTESNLCSLDEFITGTKWLYTPEH